MDSHGFQKLEQFVQSSQRGPDDQEYAQGDLVRVHLPRSECPGSTRYSGPYEVKSTSTPDGNPRNRVYELKSVDGGGGTIERKIDQLQRYESPH